RRGRATRRCTSELFLDSVDVETSRRLILIERQNLEELLSRPGEIARFELLAAGLERIGDHSVALRHFLAGFLDARDGFGVVDVDQKDARPDLDGLLAIAAPGGVVALLQERLDFLVGGAGVLFFRRGARRRRNMARRRGAGRRWSGVLDVLPGRRLAPEIRRRAGRRRRRRRNERSQPRVG